MNEHTEQPADSAVEVGPVPPILLATLGLPVLAVILWFVLQFWTPRRRRSVEEDEG